jgi:hypothetical protein
MTSAADGSPEMLRGTLPNLDEAASARFAGRPYDHTGRDVDPVTADFLPSGKGECP